MHTIFKIKRSAQDIFKLRSRHQQTILSGHFPIPFGYSAITFRPGDRTSNFLEKRFRPLGSAVMVKLYSERSDHGPIPHLPFHGYRREDLAHTWKEYGDNDPIFQFTGELIPRFNARGRRLDPRTNPSLVILLVRMYNALHLYSNSSRVQIAPNLPHVYLGFDTQSKPDFEVTGGLLDLAAKRLDKPVDRLSDPSSGFLNIFLRNLWEEQWIGPDHPENRTGLSLIDSAYCTRINDSVRKFEDFSGVVGALYPNPSRWFKILTRANPVGDLAVKYKGLFDNCKELNQGQASELLQLVRNQLGAIEMEFSDNDLLWGIENPTKPLRACSKWLQDVRNKLPPYWSECTSNEDLLLALRFPNELLWASGAAKIQIIQDHSHE